MYKFTNIQYKRTTEPSAEDTSKGTKKFQFLRCLFQR